MMLNWTAWAALLLLGVGGASGGGADEVHRQVTVCDTTTSYSTTVVHLTQYVDVTVSHWVNITLTNTETDLATVTNTETDRVTVTVSHWVDITLTNTETDLATVTNTETDRVTVTDTETDSVTVTNTETVAATVTTYTTKTLVTTTFDPCPTECSISAATVNLFFWPTDRPYTYPSIYVDTDIGYTFTSPSVYMQIPTAVGTNTAHETVGPSTSHWILPLTIGDVSTIVSGSITEQLHLSDLGTDCAQTADPTAIATLVDSRCDPVLAAPKPVSSWAYPCNACGRFGMFDPPYAIPSVPALVTTTETPVVVVTPSPSPTTSRVVVTPATSPTTSKVVVTTATSPTTSRVVVTPVTIAGASRVGRGWLWLAASGLVAVILF